MGLTQAATKPQLHRFISLLLAPEQVGWELAQVFFTCTAATCLIEVYIQQLPSESWLVFGILKTSFSQIQILEADQLEKGPFEITFLASKVRF